MSERHNQPIAIVGIGLRVPGADSPESFLRLLRGGVCRIGLPPRDRWGVDPQRPGGYLDQVDRADWRALGIPPRELRQVDPQQRLLLEVAREALEDAGLTKARLAEIRTAVTCGLIWDDYLRLLTSEGAKPDGYAILGNIGSFASNRISFHFDLKGPSLTINAACASGLVAVHEACRILRAGEADLALAGACELMLSTASDAMMERLGVLSPSGCCRPLDARADGFVRGEGAAMVVLKPLAKVEPFERVYAVIAGSAVNHNGRNEWMMASSETALRDVIAQACDASGIVPDDLAYVELHGSGGPKGDLAETRALAAAFTADRAQPCRVGSLKGNLGHLGAASGIVSLVKAALSLQSREWLPTGGLEQLHPDLHAQGWTPVRECEAFQGIQYAGITATSLSGTNCHVVLRAIEADRTVDSPASYSVPISAHTAAAMEQRVREFQLWVAEHPEVPRADIAFTCTHGRDLLPHATTATIGEGEAASPKGRIVSLPIFPWQRDVFRPESVRPPAPPAADLAAFLTSAIQSLLELPEPPSPRDTFFTLGLNSITVMSLRDQVRNHFGFDIPATAFFEHPTIAALTTSLHKVAAHQSRDRQGAVPTDHDAIAIVGIGCRFPGGADTPERFWNLLRAGRDTIAPVPAGRFDGEPPIHRGAFLDQIDSFDAAFFRMSPREAVQADPQQRLFLEVAWEALENAGVDPSQLSGTRTGVYAGAFANDYAMLKQPLAERVDPYYFSGVDVGFNANRISYTLGLQGPSLTVDTACSSSLVALHLATRALRAGECNLALAGGVSLMLSPEIGLFLGKAGTLSPAGLCRAFDRDADGMVRGEGCGIVVLKRLRDAEADGDNIVAVIRGSAVNHGGASGGLTVPNPTAQAALYRDALRDAGVDATEVAHIEAHGTGTRLGDPVELHGLSSVYRNVHVGSVKTNIGHTDAAAGIAGVIKSALMLRHSEVPPSLNFAEPTPEFDWTAHQFAVPTNVSPLKGKVAVSSFGLGGTNAHVLMESIVPATLRVAPLALQRAALLPLSARSPEALQHLAASFAQDLSTEGPAISDVCHTTAKSRAGLPFRLAVAGRTRDEFARRLEHCLSHPQAPREAREHSAGQTVFVFPGQGGQWFGMGRELCLENPVFAAKLREIDEYFRPLAGRGILPAADADPSSIHDTDIAQPAIFAMQIGLAAVWQSMGVRPDAVVGHSMGEIAAAHVAGCLDLADAVSVIYHRSRILRDATGEGRMLAASLTPEDAEVLIEPFRDVVSVGVINGPRSVVLSGAVHAIGMLSEELKQQGVFHRELQVRYASHCPQMDRFQDRVRQALAHIRPHAGTVPLHSTVSGRPQDGSALDADYWAANFREPVLFAPVVTQLAQSGANAFVELSPHPILDSALADCVNDAIVVSSTRRDEPEAVVLLESLGELYRAGYPVDFARVNPVGGIVELPNYPWQRQRYWLKTTPEIARTGGHPLLGERLASPLPQTQYQSVVRRSTPEFLADHGLRQATYFPAAAMIEMIFAAGFPNIQNLHIESPLVLDDDAVRLQLTVDGKQLAIHSSRNGSDWERHATAVAATAAKVGQPIRLSTPRVPVTDFYASLDRRGYRYQGAFRSIRTIATAPAQAAAEVAMPEDAAAFHFHPAALDACLHAALALVPDLLLVPVSIDAIQLHRTPQGDLRALIQQRDSQFDIEIHDAEGLCARIDGLTLKAAGAQRPVWQDWCYRLQWTPAPPASPASSAPARFLWIADEESATLRFLRDRGHDCVVTQPDLTDPGAFHRLLDNLDQKHWRPDHIVYAPRESDYRALCGGALHLAQALESRRPAPRLWLVTTGAQSLDNERVSTMAAGLWGLGRVIARELPFLACTNVDLDPQSDDPRALWRELCAEPGESQVLIRRGNRYALRLEPVGFPSDRSFRIGIDRYGQFDELDARPIVPPEPAAGQVVIRTEAVPLNFRDALNALGMLPDYAAELGIAAANQMPFGFECGGIVIAVGEGVTHFAPGDRVIAGPISGALATHVVADARRVYPVPTGIDLVAAAGLPVVFMTAAYALEHLAKLQPGERVLIHAAAGGVGMVAVQIAQRIGAEIFATAHPDKWPALRALGITHLMSSRDLTFADEILRITDGRGVNVVLNSLSGPMIEAGLRACAPAARFIEIGKKEIWSAEQVAKVRKDIHYEAFTFSEVADAQPSLVSQLQRELADQLADGRLRPLPTTHFPVSNVADAFRFLAQARHTGKVVIDMPRASASLVRPQSAYWITGGMGALGLELAQWLLDRGATRVILSGRSAHVDTSALQAGVEYRPCDVASADAVHRFVAGLQSEGADLRGIFHAAGVIEDSMIAGQNLDRLMKTFGPKGDAVRNLHHATAALPLDWFVLFSSTAAILGPAGQANYAAANAVMDAFAHDRRAQGLPALSINWGPWADAGLAAGLSEKNRKRLTAQGIDFIPPQPGLAAMEALMSLPLAQAAVVPAQWDRYVASLPPGCPTRLFEHVAPGRRQPPRNLLAELEGSPPAQRREVLESFIREQVARALGMSDGSRIGPRQRLFDLGVDSLMAVELRNRLESGLKQPLRRTLIFDFPRIDALTAHLAELLHLPLAAAATAVGATQQTDTLEELPEADLTALLDEKLAAVSRYLDEDL